MYGINIDDYLKISNNSIIEFCKNDFLNSNLFMLLDSISEENNSRIVSAFNEILDKSRVTEFNSKERYFKVNDIKLPISCLSSSEFFILCSELSDITGKQIALFGAARLLSVNVISKFVRRYNKSNIYIVNTDRYDNIDIVKLECEGCKIW